MLVYLQPLPQVVLLDSNFRGENDSRYRPVGHGGTVRSVADDHAAVETLVLHHLSTQKVRQTTRRREACTLHLITART